MASGTAGPDQRSGVWAVSALTGSVRKLFGDALRARPSPDGLYIAYATAALTEVWVAGSDGQNARRIAGAEPGTIFSQVEWTPDGRRAAWIELREGMDHALQTCDRDGGPRDTIFSSSRLRTFCWVPDSRVILSLVEPPPNDNSNNLWELRVDARGQRARGRPRRLTNWFGTAIHDLSITADGARLAASRLRIVADVYIADLGRNGDTMANRRRLTAADRTSWPTSWTEDSRAVVFHSDRNGDFDVFRQGISKPAPELLLSGRGEQFQGQMDPEKSALLFMEWNSDSRDAGRLVRAPLAGESPRPLLALSGSPVAPQREQAYRGRLHTNVYPSYRCSSKPSGGCVVAEEQNGQVVFSAFDAATGAKREIKKTGVRPRGAFWDLSPDGSRIAFGKRGPVGRGGFLRIIKVADGAVAEVAKDAVPWDGAGWAADGKSLFVSHYHPTTSRLVHLNLDGRTSELYRTSNWLDRPVASPDGLRLAYSELTYDSNVWLLERSP